MSGRMLVTVLVLLACGPAQSQVMPAKQPKRWGGALQLDLSRGGDRLQDDLGVDSGITLGQGLTLSGGVFFRPADHSNFEMQVLAGFKDGEPLPVVGGPFTDVSRWVFQVLADYRSSDKWFVGGGLVLHGNPKVSSGYQDEPDIHFDDAPGAVIEGGWNWVGMQCTYIQYHKAGLGTFDASNCGVRFTFHFRKWHAAN
jgi:hypothetical protein